MKNTSHKWHFFRAGGSNQVKICSGKDIENIDKLDAKLWSALSCPTSGLTLDAKTLSLIDSDSDGRIRREEIISVCKWTCANLKNSDFLLKGSESLSIDNINTATSEGEVLYNSAKEILSNLGKASSNEISVADFSDESKIFASTPFNADGIITALSCGDNQQVKETFDIVLSCSDAKNDRSGLDGIDVNDVEKFFADASVYLAWEKSPSENSDILFMGADTQNAFNAFVAVEDKINDWFARSQVLAYNKDVSVVMLAQTDDQLVKAYVDMNTEELRKLPIVKLNSTLVVDFSDGVNPAWSSECNAFKTFVLEKILGTTQVSYAQWKDIVAKFIPFRAWQTSKPNSKVLQIEVAKLEEVAVDSNKQALLDLLSKDRELKTKVDNFALVEKLVRFSRDLCKLLKNFVSFQDFYSKGQEAIFQYGKLFIDGRMCELCTKVDNVANHSKMATLGYGYLIYCQCKRKGVADITIATMITAGDCDNLIVGRNGIFYDYQGNEWDASITKIVDNPIGISQAFFSPYKRVIKWASEQVSKQAVDADKNVVSNLTTGKSTVATKDKKMDIGTVAALGVAVGGITTAFGMILDAIFGLGYWLPLGVLGIVLAISLPSMFIAWLKLRMRNLAPLLDGNGWAINCKACVNMTFGDHLTRVASLPKGAKLSRVEEFPDKSILKYIIALLFIIAVGVGSYLYCTGFFDKNENSKNQTVVQKATLAPKAECNVEKTKAP